MQETAEHGTAEFSSFFLGEQYTSVGAPDRKRIARKRPSRRGEPATHTPVGRGFIAPHRADSSRRIARIRRAVSRGFVAPNLCPPPHD